MTGVVTPALRGVEGTVGVPIAGALTTSSTTCTHLHQIVPSAAASSTAGMGNSSSDLACIVGNAIHGLLRPVWSAFADLFASTPAASNDTVLQIEANYKQQEEQKRLLDEAEARANEREAASKRREQAAESVAEEARKQEAAAKIREEAALAAAEQASVALHRGIRPVVMPTTAEVQAAMKRIHYDKEKLHFAVCGTSGSGKSSLINAFRGLGPRGGGAAKVGVTETTSAVTRYPDPRCEVPYSRFVWYDIPGAGTTAVPDWQYFNDQGLFVFDFIVMVYDVRFTKIDVGILENCYRFHIPVFVVRSKADQHIENMMKEETDCISSYPGYEEVYDEMKRRFVDATRSDFNKHMEAMAGSLEMDACDQLMIRTQRVFIVSSSVVRRLLESEVKNGRAIGEKETIDEVCLVENMVRTVATRRYLESGKSMFQKAKEALIRAV